MPPELLQRLPTLGNVLLVLPTGSSTWHEPMPGMVLDAALLAWRDARWLVTTSAITEDGPHEWCQILDAGGRGLGRLHLLPDSDYLAWDRLTEPVSHSRRAQVALASPAILAAPGRAAVVRFRRRRLAGLHVLVALAPAAPRSAVCHRVTRRLARTEALEPG